MITRIELASCNLKNCVYHAIQQFINILLIIELIFQHFITNKLK